MVRALVSVLVQLIANAIVLVVAASILDGMTLSTSGFLIDLLIFTGHRDRDPTADRPISMRHAGALAGSSALLASFVALVVTAWISDGLQIGWHGVAARHRHRLGGGVAGGGDPAR